MSLISTVLKAGTLLAAGYFVGKSRTRASGASDQELTTAMLERFGTTFTDEETATVRTALAKPEVMTAFKEFLGLEMSKPEAGPETNLSGRMDFGPALTRMIEQNIAGWDSRARGPVTPSVKQAAEIWDMFRAKAQN